MVKERALVWYQSNLSCSKFAENGTMGLGRQSTFCFVGVARKV